MNTKEAQAFTRLLNHLSGSIIFDPTDLMDDVEYLHNQACSATYLHFRLDEAGVLDTLTEVAQRHCDGGS